jgi:hypothetical protein
MTARRKILSRALVLAAITALTGTAVANASPSRSSHGKEIVGRVASLSATGFTINGQTLTATSFQLAGLAEGQCVEVKTRVGQGALNVVRIKHEDRCAPLTRATTTTTTATTPAASDDPAQHDVGDDRTARSAQVPAQQIAVDDHGQHGSNHS